MGSVRLFVAISLGEELKQQLRMAQQQFGAAAADRHARRAIRWVAPENIHLTLKFLGQVESTRVPELTTALERSTTRLSPFAMVVRGLGCFPNARRPNVLWAGLETNVSQIVGLAESVEDSFAALGYKRETRPFSPHLTLGRIKREALPSERAAIGAIVEAVPPEDYGTIIANAVHLINSDLRPEGPVYTTMASIILNDPVPRPP